MISAVVLSKNEEENIKSCLSGLKFCDEIILIDDNSTDSTVQLAGELGAKVFTRALNNDFAKQRNFGLEKAKGDWILFIDADEIVPSQLADEIVQEARSDHYSGYTFGRNDFMWGRELRHGDIKNFNEIRLARKDSGVWHRKVHERWEIKGEIGEFRNPILHYPHQTLAEFVSALDFYSTLHAQQKLEDGQRSSIIKILFWPKFKFISNYFFKLGFQDGTDGFVSAILMSFHSFLGWSKAWLLARK